MSSSFFSRLELLIAFQNRDLASAAKVLRAYGVPSTSIALLTADGIASHVISDEHGVNTDTVFQAASISKPACAMAVFRCIQAGRLALDTPITQCLSADQIALLSTKQTGHLLKHITLSQLLSHTSGLDVHGFGGYSSAHELPSTREILAGIPPSNSPQVRLVGLPGRRWYYSGGGYTVLELILETVLSKPFPEIMQELVFEPLGMTRSFYGPYAPGQNQATSWETGYTPATPPTHTFPEHAAAGMWTTPTDLLRMVQAVQVSLRGGEEGAFLEQSIARDMLTEIHSGMARGWRRESGSPAFSHSGMNSPGWCCHLLGFLDRPAQRALDGDTKAMGNTLKCGSEGLAVMTNGALGFDVVSKILHAIAWLRAWPSNAAANYTGHDGQTAIPFACDAPYIKLRKNSNAIKASQIPRGKDFKKEKAEQSAWAPWIGEWAVKGKEKEQPQPHTILTILATPENENDQQNPHLHFHASPDEGSPLSIPLLPAAIAPFKYPSGSRRSYYKVSKKQSLDFVVNGLNIMLRLGWDREVNGKRQVEVWYGFMEGSEILERVGEESEGEEDEDMGLDDDDDDEEDEEGEDEAFITGSELARIY